MNLKTNKRWLEHEDALIADLYKADYPIIEIAERVNRTVDATRQRLFTLRHNKSQGGFAKRQKWFEGARFGFFDIEASDLKANFGFMISWVVYCPDATDLKPKGYKAQKPKDDMPGVLYYDIATKRELIDYDKQDKRICKSFIKCALEQCEILVSYYGTGFDIPFLRSRSMFWKIEFPPVGSLYHLDMFYRCRSLGKLHRNSLEAHTKHLKIEGKDHVLGEIWSRAKLGDKEALGYILNHNLEDCMILYKLYERFKPYFRLTKKSI